MIACWAGMIVLLTWAIFAADTVSNTVFASVVMGALTLILLRKIFKGSR